MCFAMVSACVVGPPRLGAICPSGGGQQHGLIDQCQHVECLAGAAVLWLEPVRQTGRGFAQVLQPLGGAIDLRERAGLAVRVEAAALQ